MSQNSALIILSISNFNSIERSIALLKRVISNLKLESLARKGF